MDIKTAEKVLDFLKEEYKSGRYEQYEYALNEKKHFTRDGHHFWYDWDGDEICVYHKEEHCDFSFEPWCLVGSTDEVKAKMCWDDSFVEILRYNLSRSEWDEYYEFRKFSKGE